MEKIFSGMKIVKTIPYQNNMNDEFLAYNSVVYFEKDIANLF